ncbi:MAG: hypothetical protein LBF51_04300 [Zoogloeaceae bacterium]|nr:hypothetical protein [Zoogloeaceae bacterium]
MIAIPGVKERVKLTVCHEGKIGIVAQISGEGFQFPDRSFFLQVAEKSVFQTGKIRGAARKRKMRRRFVAINQALPPGICWTGLGNRSVQGFVAGDPAQFSIRVSLLFPPGNGKRSGIGFLSHAIIQGIDQDKGIAIDIAALGKYDGFILIEAIVPPEIFAQLRKPSTGKIEIEIKDRYRLFGDFCRNIPVVALIQGRHLRPGFLQHGVPFAFQMMQRFIQVADSRVELFNPQKDKTHRPQETGAPQSSVFHIEIVGERQNKPDCRNETRQHQKDKQNAQGMPKSSMTRFFAVRPFQ